MRPALRSGLARAALALATVAAAAPAVLPTSAALAAPAAPASKLKPKDNALYILRSGLKSADFHARGLAYRGLAYDKGNKEARQQLEDGMQDPQWVVRQGIAEAFYALRDPRWKQLVHDALAMPVISPYDVLPALDAVSDKDAFAVLIEVLGDKEHDQQKKVVAALVGRNRANLGEFFKVALASKDLLVAQSALEGVQRLDPVLQGAALQTVAKAHGTRDDVVKILVEIAEAADERLPVPFLAALKSKDPGLAERVLVARAMHGDRTVGKALLDVCKKTQGKQQLAALAAYKRVADKGDAETLKALLAGASSSELVFAVYELLARMGDRSMAKEAQDLADSTDVDVRATGVFYLGWVGGAGRIGEMHGYLADGIASVRVAAARVIGYIASPVSVAPLRDSLERERDDRVRIELIKALAQIKDKVGYEALMFFTREKDQELRRIVVRALAESGDAAVRSGLQNALNDSVPRIRAEAVRGFILSDVAEAVKVWRRALRWIPRGVLLELTREMTKTMEGFIEIALFDGAKDEQGVALREEALIALSLLPAAEATLLHKVLATTDDEDLRVRVLGRLFEIEGKKVATEVKSLALSSGLRTRVAAIRLLAKLKGDKEAGELLVRFQDEPDERIRIAAALTLVGG